MKFVCNNRHTGMDSCRAILPGTLRVNANPLRADLCRYPGHKDVIQADPPWSLGSGNPCRNDELFAEFPVENLLPSLTIISFSSSAPSNGSANEFL
jgi:hypothetical protein